MSDPDDDPQVFGFDSIDNIDGGAWGYDVIDVLRERAIPMRCTGCRAWLYGAEAQEAGKCWRCRTGWAGELS